MLNTGLWRSIKREDVYLKGYANIAELMLGLDEYFAFYNGERLHQALTNLTPDAVYATASGGGARIANKFSSNGVALFSYVIYGTNLN